MDTETFVNSSLVTPIQAHATDRSAVYTYRLLASAVLLLVASWLGGEAAFAGQAITAGEVPYPNDLKVPIVPQKDYHSTWHHNYRALERGLHKEKDHHKRRVRFHVRDRQASRDDLDDTLAQADPRPDGTPRGALLFSCLGRGRTLYGEPDHDSRVFLGRFPHVPLGGFFCAGEIGPVGRATHLHGFTSSFGLFGPRG